jgi:hypothetical protein
MLWCAVGHDHPLVHRLMVTVTYQTVVYVYGVNQPHNVLSGGQ